MHPLETRFIAEIEMLAAHHQCLLWAMDKTYTKELFVSSTFKTLWGREVPSIYHNKTASDWHKYAEEIISDKVWAKLSTRVINPKYTAIYGLKLLDGTIQLVLDRSFHLNDAEGNCVIVAGVAKFISEDDLIKAKQEIISNEIDIISLEFYRLLSLPYPLSAQSKSDAYRKLTSQHKAIFKYLIQGLTAKEIAKEMHLSFRTIEFHINSIKKRFRVKNKSELISLAITKNWITLHL